MISSNRSDRTWLCSVVFLDIAGYSEQSVTRQVTMSGSLQQLVTDAIAGIPESERIVVGTGDGAALCFLGDPVEALLAAMRLRESLAVAERGDTALKTRIGIHLGPVKVLKTLGGQPNPLGDGINNAQRVMSFAEPNQILVSRSFYEVIACLSQEYAPLFAHLGVRKDKHAKEHELYALRVPASNGQVTTRVTQILAEQERAAPPSRPPQRSDAELQALAQELAEIIGPLAAVLVRKTASRVHDDEAFYRTVAEALPEGERRQRFLAAHGIAADAVSVRTKPPSTGRTAGHAWDEAELSEAERRLTVFLGPVARVLVRRTAKGTTDREQFYRQLADELASENDREVFLRGLVNG